MINITLFNTSTSAIESINITYLNELSNLVTLYFGINPSKQILKYNGSQIDITQSIKKYNIMDGDLISIESIDNDALANTNNSVVDDLENSYLTHSAIYINVSLGDYKFRAMLDSGAQPNVLSREMAKFLGIDNLIDNRVQGTATGVGSCKIEGCIQDCTIQVGNLKIPVNFKIAQIELDPHLVLLGLDFLINYQCSMDFATRTLRMGEKYNYESIRFLNELQIDEYKFPINCKKDQIKSMYIALSKRLDHNKHQAVKTLLSSIIDAILKHPNIDKYRRINTKSKTFKSTFDDAQTIEFMKQLGFNSSGDWLSFDDNLETLNYTKEVICSA
jgi:hypothetical protein